MRTSPSGGRYIGQTTRTEAERWKQHCEEANKPTWYKTYNTILSKAIRKYGGENFSVNILEDNIPDDKLDDREIYYIEYYHTFCGDNQGGYNMTRGGFGGRKLDAKIIMDLWESGFCISEIYRECDYCYMSIRQLLKSHGVKREDIKAHMGKRISAVLTSKYDKKDSIYQLWLDGKNLSEIADILGTTLGTVSKYLKEEFNVTPEEIRERGADTAGIKHIKNIRVLQCTKDGNLVKEWCNAKEAADALNCKSYNILACCRKEQKTAYGYIWRYKD